LQNCFVDGYSAHAITLINDATCILSIDINHSLSDIDLARNCCRDECCAEFFEAVDGLTNPLPHAIQPLTFSCNELEDLFLFSTRGQWEWEVLELRAVCRCQIGGLL
jgi:hypothetical protein